MALDLRNDNTLLYFLQNDLEKTYRKILLDTEAGKTGLATKLSLQEVEEAAQALDALIQENGNRIEEFIGETYQEYISKTAKTLSDYGASIEKNELAISTNADRIEEAYQEVGGVSGRINDIELNYLKVENGMIQRGFLNVGGAKYFGIAVGHHISVDATVSEVGEDGETYYQLDSSQRLGLYTAEGWRFYDGSKIIGFFDSQVDNGVLQTPGITIDGNIRMKGNWLMTSVDENGNEVGWGIRWIGG